MADVTIAITIPDALVPRAVPYIQQFMWDGKPPVGPDATAAQLRARAKEITAWLWREQVRNFERMQPSTELDGIA
jgi:hypothetical protein